MNEEGETKKESCRPWWNGVDLLLAHTESHEEATEEILAIDKMEEAIEPLDEQTTKIRGLIAGFESCYHEADIEADRIIKAIGCGQCPEDSNERPPQRKKELEDCYQILSRWCEDTAVKDIDLKLADISAENLVNYIGQASPLKLWQVERIVDKVTEALDRSQPYHMMAVSYTI